MGDTDSINDLNQSLTAMDVMVDVIHVRSEMTLTLVFECHDGGSYENIKLEVLFTEPITCHLPLYTRGEFKLVQVTDQTRMIELAAYEFEGDEQVYELHVDGTTAGFYVCAHGLSWRVSGPGSKNNKRLMDECSADRTRY